MPAPIPHPPPPASERLSPARSAVLLASARQLQQAAAAGTSRPLLRGLNIGLLCEEAPVTDSSCGAGLLRRAALALGAQVALVRPSQWQPGTPQELQHTLRMLGRFYEALACEGLPATLVQQIRTHAGVRVYENLAGREHPSAELVAQLEGPAPATDKRCYLLQALLLDELG